MSYITVFTPTYNRAYIIENLYKSLLKQKTEFEWIIVDDGSTDNTKDIIKKFINEKKINIRYFFQKNSGKHIAINVGVEHAKGEIFVIVDSDDFLCENALSTIDKYFNEIKKDKTKKFAGIAGLKIYPNKEIIGKTFKDAKYIDATSLERDKYNIIGDKAEVFYTKVLKNYKFPKIENENFISEAYIWNKIAADNYALRWINEPLIICEYIEDGITRNRREITEKNPKGTLLYLKDLIKFEKNFFKKIAHYASYCGVAQKIYNKKEIIKQLKINYIKLEMFLLIYKIRERK